MLSGGLPGKPRALYDSGVKAVLYRYQGEAAGGKNKYESVVLADHDWLKIDLVGGDMVQITQKGPKVVAVIRLGEQDHIKLEGVGDETD